LPLIASSIMSKKLAAGADVIVLDVKCGRGAFMATREEAHRLASLMVAIGARAGRRMAALITQMEEPLGKAVGNALEVREAIEALQGKGPQDLRELAEVLAIEIVVQAAITPEARVRAAARRRVVEAIESGAALAKFREFVAAQGGDTTVVDDPGKLPSAPVVKEVRSPRRGWVEQVDAREVGLTVVELGGGRVTKADRIDPAVGVLLVRKVGASVAVGDTLCTVHAASEAAATRAAERLAQAFVIGDRLVAPLPMVYGRVESTQTTSR
jgi:pyrimidine-nucleoside phosphorylase